MKITIGGEDYTKHIALPVSLQRTLNDQLDTAMLTLVHMRERLPFKPFTEVTYEVDGVVTTFLLAIDNVREIFGRKRYNHELTLIEETKISERILMEAKAFTQPLVKNYGDRNTLASYYEKNSSGSTADWIHSPGETVWIGVCGAGYYSPLKMSENKTIPIYPQPALVTSESVYIDTTFGSYKVFFQNDKSIDPVVIEYAGGEGSGADAVHGTRTEEDQKWWNTPHDLDVSEYGSGVYSIVYSRVYSSAINSDGGFLEVNIEIVDTSKAEKPPHTIDDIIAKLLDVAEPLREGLDEPRFHVAYTDEQFDTVRTQKAPPQLIFSGGRSLWENLRQIGSVIHAIPRIDGSRISFDELGSTRYADMSKGRLFGFSDSYNASDYAAALEANVSNLINSEDISEGAVTEPFSGGYRSLRAASETVRIKDDTGIIHTAFPIEKVVSLKFRYALKDGTVISGDITPYVFERAEYDLLSSYSGGYPSSKIYALEYGQGSPNIQGLWYRADDSGSDIVDSLFKRPAIVNIMAASAGVNALSISDNYPDMCFEVTYLTVVSARVRQHRTSYDGKDELVMAYNQSANRLSSRSFGEAIRGQIAMMGTTSTSVLYLFKRYSDVPHAGLLYDDDNYISSVTTRVYRDFCVSQIDLSTGYNEIGAYSEMNNAIRQYEIPGAEERFTVIEEFCVVGDVGDDDPNTAATFAFKRAMARMLEGDAQRASKQISLASVSTYDEDGSAIAEGLLLPVVSYSLGTAIYFGFRFADNYSAGQSSEDPPIASAKYRLQKDAPYGDKYYAEASKLNFSLYAEPSMTDASLPFSAHDLPEMSEGISLGTEMVSLGAHPLIWHKDSADAGNVSYQLHFVSDSDFIIGSGLARSCPYIRGTTDDTRARFYFFDHRINQLTGTIKTADAVAESDFDMIISENVPIEVIVSSVPTVPFKSWAFIRGDEFLFGKNESKIEESIYFKFKRKRR